jgi:hypothetical protein
VLLTGESPESLRDLSVSHINLDNFAQALVAIEAAMASAPEQANMKPIQAFLLEKLAPAG